MVYDSLIFSVSKLRLYVGKSTLHTVTALLRTKEHPLLVLPGSLLPDYVGLALPFLIFLKITRRLSSPLRH